MSVQHVPLGRLRTPFYERMVKLDTLNTWHEWKGYSTPDALYCAETEYFAIRNATAVFDVAFENGVLSIFLKDATIKWQPLPEMLMAKADLHRFAISQVL